MRAPASTSVYQLIADHITARAEHDRLFGLADWGMADQAAVNDAVNKIDIALLAICRARPSVAPDAELRQKYLSDILPDAMAGERGLTRQVVAALIDAGGKA